MSMSESIVMLCLLRSAASSSSAWSIVRSSFLISSLSASKPFCVVSRLLSCVHLRKTLATVLATFAAYFAASPSGLSGLSNLTVISMRSVSRRMLRAVLFWTSLTVRSKFVFAVCVFFQP